MPKAHFIGIGGIGVSSLAQYYLATGWQVSGSDASRSEITDDLRKKGVSIFVGQKAENIKSPDLVIYSAAVKPDNPELSVAISAKIKTQLYSQAVGELTKKYFTIAVSGSHGKSTTTALVGLILKEAGLDPTIIIGTKLKELHQNNFRLGQSQYLVLEADEYARSFHNYFPKIAVVTNIDKEHLDIYQNLTGIRAGFKKFFKNVGSGGWIVANKEDVNIRKIIKSQITNPKSQTNSNKQIQNPQTIWYGRGKHKLSISGTHNQFNAEAAWQAVKLLGVKKNVADKVFRNYQGAWRRLEKLNIKYQKSKIRSLIYSDYAHHPTEIKATLQALKGKYPKRKLICVFQPHQQDRLNRLFKEFTTAFNLADKTILYPLYRVKGRDTVGKTSEELCKDIKQNNVFYAPDFKKVRDLLAPDFNSDSVIVFMSAGNLDALARKYFSK